MSDLATLVALALFRAGYELVRVMQMAGVL